ncbi:MAG: hypothetical protein IMW99_02895 [Firmicutes bacterium]|nr:hypothetical protein [Bacillota bacterium]
MATETVEAVEYLPQVAPSSWGVETHNLLMRHRDGAADKLMVVLPGEYYSADRPVLDYVRKMGFQRGYDVFSVQYGFQAAGVRLDRSGLPRLQDETLAVVGSTLAGYRSFCFVGKSLGTPLAVELARRTTAGTDAGPRPGPGASAGAAPGKPSGTAVSLILLTPVPRAVAEDTGAAPALAVIGTADPFYSDPDIQAALGRRGVEWRVFPGLNHSLEVPGDWRASVAVLPQVLAACDDFLARI